MEIYRIKGSFNIFRSLESGEEIKSPFNIKQETLLANKDEAMRSFESFRKMVVRGSMEIRALHTAQASSVFLPEDEPIDSFSVGLDSIAGNAGTHSPGKPTGKPSKVLMQFRQGEPRRDGKMPVELKLLVTGEVYVLSLKPEIYLTKREFSMACAGELWNKKVRDAAIKMEKAYHLAEHVCHSISGEFSWEEFQRKYNHQQLK